MFNYFKIILVLIFTSITISAQGHSAAVVTMGGSDNVNGYYTNQTTYLEYAFTIDAADDDNVGDIELRALVTASNSNPSGVNTGQYATRMQVYWDTQNGCSSGNSVVFSCGSIDDSETFTLKVYQSAIEALSGFENGKKL
ncbi:MAG: hypothetical protein HOG33_06435, partial [Candidatus Marinimicrobia bacterium]|nr:hypothetical protein [Candidatus Neomarinimicrobiota bacterium]